ncbi:UV damage repair endonuclease UvsE [Bacillus cereus]|nr:UV damage repair endonuclease UvsE [Bacillus cereus]
MKDLTSKNTNIGYGYACINTEINSRYRTTRLDAMRKYGMQRIKDYTLDNIQTCLHSLRWNYENGINMYRIGSQLVPFGSHPEMTWQFYTDKDVLELAERVADFKYKHNMRLSMHPGQTTVINSPRLQVVENSIRELEYSAQALSILGGDDMILHVGGAYGDKLSAMNRWSEVYNDRLSPLIRKYLRLENDDKVFNLEDVLYVNSLCGVPVCMDIHHDRCNPSSVPAEQLFNSVYKTWNSTGIHPKVHISSGKEHENDRRHHDYISSDDYKRLVSIIGNKRVDIMFECKMKEQGIIKLQNEGVLVPSSGILT